MSGDGGPALPPARPLRWLCEVEGCGYDYADVVHVLLIAGPEGTVLGFLAPLRCPGCGTPLPHGLIASLHSGP